MCWLKAVEVLKVLEVDEVLVEVVVLVGVDV